MANWSDKRAAKSVATRAPRYGGFALDLSFVSSFALSLVLSLALFPLVSLCFSSAASAAEIEDLRLWRAPDHTRLVFDLSESADYNLFTLDSPERVVIDIEKSSLATRLLSLIHI